MKLLQPRKMSGALSFSAPRPTEITLTVHYYILWDGDAYEVTVVAEPDEEGTEDFIARANKETLAHCESFVKKVLADELTKSAHDMIVYSEEI